MVCLSTNQAKPTTSDLFPRFIAAERPPHLKAIAPWEGFADFYREFNGGGGIPNYAFVDYCASGYRGMAFLSQKPYNLLKQVIIGRI